MLLKTKCANTWNTPLGSAAFPYKFQPSSIYSVCHIWTEPQTRGYILITIFFSGDITKYHTGNVLTERVILTRPESRKKKFQKPTKNINCSIFPLWRKKCVAVTLQNQFLSISFFLKTSEWPTQNGWPQHGPNCSHYVKSK